VSFRENGCLPSLSTYRYIDHGRQCSATDLKLPVRKGAPTGAAWGVFGDDDELGTINLLTPERIREAAREVLDGVRVPLNLPLNFIDPPRRNAYTLRRVVMQWKGADAFMDDYLDGFNTQISSQWDALAHFKHATIGHYNGFATDQVAGWGGSKLGIDRLARIGIAGRGVVADVARFYERRGKTITHTQAMSVSAAEVQATLDEQKTRVKVGDILLIRFGWTKFYASATAAVRQRYAQGAAILSGLESSTATCRWLWDSRFAAVASDVPALEASPKTEAEDQQGLHTHLLVLFGYANRRALGLGGFG
jgi:kynurenine formamidase